MFDKKTNIAAQEAFGEAVNSGSLAFDDLVAPTCVDTLTGTHDGPFQGHPATGRPVSVRGVQISRFEDGKMVERWGSSDQLGILTQLGLADA